jgi:hypothetical protein
VQTSHGSFINPQASKVAGLRSSAFLTPAVAERMRRKKSGSIFLGFSVQYDMERKWISLLAVVGVSFGTGFGVCYKIYGPARTQTSVANNANPPVKIALLTRPGTERTSTEVRPEGGLDWEPYLIRPTLPPKVIERYHYTPQPPTEELNPKAPAPTIRFLPNPSVK